MSNEYFNKPADIEAQTRALHTSINTLSQTVDKGFDALPTNLSGLKFEVESARDGEASLSAKEQAQDTATQIVTNEVITARDAFPTLLEKERAQDDMLLLLQQEISEKTIFSRDGLKSFKVYSGEVFTIFSNTQYSLDEEFDIEGILDINGTGFLTINN